MCVCVCLYEKGGIEYVCMYIRRTKKNKNQQKQEEEEEDYEKLYKIKKHHIEY